MSGTHPDLGPELRQLAQAILDKLDPAVRTAAGLAAARAGQEPGRCQQVWCPVCALAALVTGEEHPLIAVISEHSVALVAVIRAVIGETEPGSAAPASPPAPPAGSTPTDATAAEAESTATNGRYEPIPVTIEE